MRDKTSLNKEMYFHKEFVLVVEINNLVVFDNNLRGSPLLSQGLSVTDDVLLPDSGFVFLRRCSFIDKCSADEALILTLCTDSLHT